MTLSSPATHGVDTIPVASSSSPSTHGVDTIPPTSSSSPAYHTVSITPPPGTLGLDGLKVLHKVIGSPYLIEVRGLVRIFSAPIDTTVGGVIGLFVVPAGITLVSTGASMRCTAAANVAAPATVNITIQGAVSGPIYASQELIGLLVAGDLFRFPVGGAGVTAGPGAIIVLNIDAPATGASVSQTAQIELNGYLV